MSKSTFKILFYLRKNYVNKEGKASIMIRITVNGEMSQFSSKLDVEPRLWDTKLGRLSIEQPLPLYRIKGFLCDCRKSKKCFSRI